MLFLLRQIRRKLLTSNKVTTYLLYAIGEIVLVVVGILIAIQIDESLESKQQQKLYDFYKTSLINDLVKDSSELQQHIDYYQNKVNQLSDIINRLEQPTTTIDTIVSIARYDHSPSFLQYNDWGSGVIYVLSSTGNINLFDQRTILAITQLQDTQREAYEILDNQIETYGVLFVGYTNTYSTAASWSKINGITDELTWQSIDKVQLTKDLRGILTFQKALMDSFLKEKRKVFDQTMELLTLLEKS